MFAALLCVGILAGNRLFASGDTLTAAAKQVIAREMCNALYAQFIPAVSLVREETTILQSQIIEVMPLYGYVREQMQSVEDPHSEELLYGELFPGESRSEDVLEMEELTAGQKGETDDPAEADLSEQDFLADMLQAENEAALLAREQQRTEFIPHEAQTQIDLGAFSGYEELVQRFYTIDANTMAGSDQLDVDKLMSYDMTIDKTAQGPQILIYHTHSQEAFADSVPGDESTTIIGVGEELTRILTEQYGYQVLHHMGKYDVASRDDAYAAALPDLEQILAQNPTIQVVIDLHRDEMAEGTRLVTDLDGRPTARFMFFNGLSRTKKTGDISYLENEYQEDNLAFSFQMQLAAETYYPGLARRIYLKGYRYNMHLCPKSLLIEVGAQNSTLEEMMNACGPIAHILDLVLSGQ